MLKDIGEVYTTPNQKSYPIFKSGQSGKYYIKQYGFAVEVEMNGYGHWQRGKTVVKLSGEDENE